MFGYIKLGIALYINTLVCFNLDLNAQVNNKSSIKGFIKGLDDQTIFLLRNKDTGGKPDTIAITQSRGGKFSIEGIAVNGAEFLFLRLDTNTSKLSKTLFVEKDRTMILKGAVNEWPARIAVSGSLAHQEYINFRKVDTAFAKDEGGKEKRYAFWRSFIEANPQSFYTPFLVVRFQSQLGVEGLKAEYARLTPRNKSSHWGIQLRKEIDYNMRRAQLKLGGTVQDFASIMPNGQKLSLYEVVKKDKYTLIDFWASWCLPCIEEFRNVKKVYQTYHPLGLNIIAISNDNKEASWKKAILKHELPWYNVSDLDGNDGVLAKSFGIYKLPTNFLVDSTGKIVAIDIFEEELGKKMEQLLGTNREKL